MKKVKKESQTDSFHDLNDAKPLKPARIITVMIEADVSDREWEFWCARQIQSVWKEAGRGAMETQ